MSVYYLSQPTPLSCATFMFLMKSVKSRAVAGAGYIHGALFHLYYREGDIEGGGGGLRVEGECTEDVGVAGLL